MAAQQFGNSEMTLTRLQNEDDAATSSGDVTTGPISEGKKTSGKEKNGWGAKSPRGRYPWMPAVRYVFIHHSDTPTCYDTNSFARRIRSFQNYHINSRGWSNIGYSFLVGGDGKVYEGRGWNHVRAHTSGYNSKGIAPRHSVVSSICVIGDFTHATTTSAQLAAVQALIRCGVRKGAIKSSYVRKGHRDVSSSTCPGNVLYGIIRRWPHF
ncbi:N-acetylmuramoyl-L-alanine amidase [Lamellibrachia satsuma]|nr:N-acetylmuramoyl-L-alanine amidase [Lamellibrachia satsuma]